MNRRPFPRIPRYLAAAVLLTFSTLACTLPGGSEASLPDDGPPVAVSQGAASSFAAKALASAEGSGTLSFTITQEEATSAVAVGVQLMTLSKNNPLLENFDEIPDQIDLDQMTEDLEVTPEIEALLKRFSGSDGQGPNLPNLRLGLDEPQIYFKGDGRMILRGYGLLGNWRLPLRVVTKPRAARGELELDFVEGQIGRLPLPEFLFDPLGKVVSRMLLAGQDYAEISQLTVGPGTLTFTGRVNVDNLPLE